MHMRQRTGAKVLWTCLTRWHIVMYCFIWVLSIMAKNLPMTEWVLSRSEESGCTRFIPVLELVLLSGCILLRHLLLYVLICPPIKDACLDLIEHLQPHMPGTIDNQFEQLPHAPRGEHINSTQCTSTQDCNQGCSCTLSQTSCISRQRAHAQG